MLCRRNLSYPRELLRPRRLLACAVIVAISIVGLPGAASAVKRDTQPPSIPPNLHATSATSAAVTFSWGASTDNVRVVGYDIDVGSSPKRVKVAGLNYMVTGLSCGTSVNLKVTAYDRAGNRSAAATAAGSTTACAPGPPPPPPASGAEPGPIAGMRYRQVFRDDFDTLNRGVWDDHVWYDGPPSSAWTNFQYAQNGILHLATSRYCGSGCNYPINTVTTQSSGKTFQYGYFEARMNWTGGHGAWPGFWLYSYRHATNPSWPSVNPICSQRGEPVSHCYAGELDVFEGQGSEPQAFYGTIHRNSCGCYGVGDQQNGNNWQPAGIDLTAGFHSYGMLWTPTQVSWYLDGRLLMSATPYDSLNQPMFLLLQMWTGGWTYDPDSTTPNTIETQVDYVQVWQK